MTSTMRLCSVFLVLFQFGLSTASDCDFTVVSGNVTITGKTALTRISEKEKLSDLCALEAQGKPKITCDLTSAYFDCRETPFSGDNDGLNVSLIASVDDIADKPNNKVSFFGIVDCSSHASSHNIETPTNLIMVKIDTVNDHTPEITSSSLDIPNLPETLPFGDPRYDLASIYGLQIQAIDLDTAGDYTSKVQFAITAGNDDSTFTISTTTFNPGTNDEYFVVNLYLAKALDYGEHPNYSLNITAKDQGVPSLESSVLLTIEVEPENTVGPVFNYDFYRAVINDSLIDGEKHEISMQPEDIHAGRSPNAESSSDVIYSILIDDCGPSCDAIKASFALDQNSAKVTFDSQAPYQDINNHVAIFGVKATWNDAFKRSSLAIVSISLPSLVTTTTSTERTTETTTSGGTTATTSIPETTTETNSTETTTSGGTTATTNSPETTTETNSTEITTSGGITATTNSPETSTATNSTETTTSGTCPTCPPCPTTPATTETPYEITNATTTETSFPLNTTITTISDTTTTVTSHQTSPTTEMPVPVPSFEFYEIANVAVTTLVTSVILVIRFQDDVTHTYRYTATDCDGFHLGTNYFSVDDVTGSVAVKQQLVVQQFCLNVTATSASEDRNYKAVIIDVFNGTLEEILSEDYYEVHINESKEDTVQLLVDLDSFYEEKHMAIYELNTPVDPGYFLLNSSTGQLFAIKGLDHETNPVYQLIISVSSFLDADHVLDRPFQFGNLSHNEVLVRVIVDDINDHAPQFDVGSHYAVGITSYVGEGQTVMILSATDADDTEAFNRIYYTIADTAVPFFVNINSGILRSSQSMEVLQSAGISTFDLVVTAANSPDGQEMPNQLHLTIYVLKADEILVIQTRKSGIDFDEISSKIIDTFKTTLHVDVRIIQWETNADGSTVAYIYMLPLENNNLSSSRAKRYATSGDGPIDKAAMLSMIKKNAESLQDYFVTDTAETYDDLPQPNNRPSTSGLIAAIVVLSTIVGVILIVGAIVGVLLHRKFAKADNSYVNNTSETEPAHNYEDLLPVKTRIHTFQDMDDMNRALKSSDNRKASSESTNSDRSESIVEKSTKLDDDESHPENVGNGIIAAAAATETSTTSLPDIPENPDAEPELDYLKSILVADQQKDTKRDKPIVKFADDITSEQESTCTDDVRL